MRTRLIPKEAKDQAYAMIQEAKTIALAGHDHPDGDCLGAILGLGQVLLAMGKEVDCLADEKPKDLSYIPGFSLLKKQTDEKTYDLFIRLDLGFSDRMKNGQKALKNSKRTLNVDHHLENDGLCDLALVDTKASSTCEILAQFVLEYDLPLSADAATALYTGIITDSNRYLYDTADAMTLRTGADLLDRGANARLIFLKEYQEMDPICSVFTGDMIREALHYQDGKIILANLTQEKLTKYGLPMSSAESLVDAMRNLEGVEVAVILKEQGPKIQKISFRSKQYYDVAELAKNFSGGGHTKAAGGKIEKTNAEAYADLQAFLEKVRV